MNKSVADIRTDYVLKTLTEAEVKNNPMAQFEVWWNEAVSAKLNEVNAFTLATATPDGKPQARIMLLKNYDAQGFTFFTNYSSRKGKTIGNNPFAAMCFFWKELERQVRIEGCLTKVSEQESDEYFNSRPLGSRIGAWVSAQSSVIASKDVLIQKEAEVKQQFENKEVTRPAHWGGYKIMPTYIEFWQGGGNRLHDRICYTLQDNGLWLIERLSP